MGKKITCLGSFVVDLTCRAPRLPIVGESLLTDFFKMGPGGKGSNQAVAAKRANANITLMTKIGKDLLSNVAIDSFRREGFDEKYIIIDDEKDTGIALIMVDKTTGANFIMVTPAACGNINDNDIKLLTSEIENCDIFLTQLEVNIDAIEKSVDIAYKNKKTIVLNTAPVIEVSSELISKVTIIVANEVEASILTNVDVVDFESAKKSAYKFFDKGIPQVIITLGKLGAYIHDGKNDAIIDPIDLPVIDTTGAGDAFIGGLVTALSEERSLIEASKFATAVASLSVTKIGTAPSMPYRKEIDELIKSVYEKYY